MQIIFYIIILLHNINYCILKLTLYFIILLNLFNQPFFFSGYPSKAEEAAGFPSAPPPAQAGQSKLKN